jgi:hypothetical protein
VLYLHNGSVIRGQIQAQRVGEWVRIELLGGDELTIAQAEIEQIRREISLFRKVKLRLRKELLPIQLQHNGLFQHFSFGMGAYQGLNGELLSPSIGYRLGYQFHPRLRVGVGIGLDKYVGGNIAPFMLHLSGDLLRRKSITPCYVLEGGYGIAAGRTWRFDVLEGGPMAHAGVGIHFFTRSRYHWMLTLGYKFQETYEEFVEWPEGRILNNGQWFQPDPVNVRGTRLNQRVLLQLSLGL